MRTAKFGIQALLVTACSMAMVTGSASASDAAAGNVYYVAPNGNDGAAGDTVYFRGGTYAYTRANSACANQTARVDAITLNKSGSSGNPICATTSPTRERRRRTCPARTPRTTPGTSESPCRTPSSRACRRPVGTRPARPTGACPCCPISVSRRTVH